MTQRKPNKSGKYRLSVPLSEKTFNRVNEEANNLWIAPTTFINIIVNKYFTDKDYSREIAKNSLSSSFDNIFASLGISKEEGEKMTKESLDESLEKLSSLFKESIKKE